MNRIALIGSSPALNMVRSALVRSFTPGCLAGPEQAASASVVVAISPGDEHASRLEQALEGGGKVLVFGAPGPACASVLGLRFEDALPVTASEAEAPNAVGPCSGQSVACIQYLPGHTLGEASPYTLRPFLRFDFTNEWNNMGYGRVRADGEIWAISGRSEPAGAVALAEIVVDGDCRGLYAAVADNAKGAALWFNRPVGPLDSLEWAVVERFLCDYRSEELSCLPLLTELPYGVRALATMRLDCDEDIASAQGLFEWYADQGLPLSLAVKTSLDVAPVDMHLLDDVLNAGGSILSHSHNHLENWGRDYDGALADARASRAWFEAHFPRACPVRYAVSPFHTNRPWSLRALADAGFEGVISGIVHNDPDMLVARPGIMPEVKRDIISHSQQCMLHGDSHDDALDGPSVPSQSFDAYAKAGAIFGYLDHPFSPRYDYGWGSEERRLTAHRELVEHISGHEGVLWLSAGDCLAYCVLRSRAVLTMDPDGAIDLGGYSNHTGLQPGVRVRGHDVPIGELA
ncbi:hypothetical protein [Oceanidesulfovibrio marinus]|uniref:Polysaccharide deacetylase n=1 Tax=Oceanidesulfovibrio marinus TaxID=370038 RepID=A0A6P1ZP36_9BACT|nr:hypothetical protein [Oceanidesulfovibrio marinus]TVM36078.1 hypothetical protein DQK91_05390 [Oceanidesulfovibrio marinus]